MFHAYLFVVYVMTLPAASNDKMKNKLERVYNLEPRECETFGRDAVS